MLKMGLNQSFFVHKSTLLDIFFKIAQYVSLKVYLMRGIKKWIKVFLLKVEWFLFPDS